MQKAPLLGKALNDSPQGFGESRRHLTDTLFQKLRRRHPDQVLAQLDPVGSTLAQGKGRVDPGAQAQGQTNATRGYHQASRAEGNRGASHPEGAIHEHAQDLVAAQHVEGRPRALPGAKYADAVTLAMLAAGIAIGSKFLIRVRGKHVFNPANAALVALMLLSDKAWVSSGQWGSAAIGSLALGCLGFLVLTRARRAETTIAFFIAFAALLTGRALWLGDPLGIPLHQLQNGALLIFAFFMISDPKTSPNSAAGRIVFGSMVAAVAYTIQFVFFQPNGPILALIMSAPLVPLIDALSHGRKYRWIRPAEQSARPIKGV